MLMNIGILSAEIHFSDISAHIDDKSVALNVCYFNSIESVYFDFFTKIKDRLDCLLLDLQFDREALVRLANCVQINFPETRVYCLVDEPEASTFHAWPKIPKTDLGYRRLKNDFISMEISIRANRETQKVFSNKRSAKENTLVELQGAKQANLQDKYELMVNSVGEAIIGIDRHGRITFVNNYACDLFESEEHKLLGSHLSDFALESPLEEGSSPTSFTAEGRSQRRVGRGVIKSKTGNMTCVEFTQTYVGNTSDDTVSVMVIEDINERVKFEAKLKSLATKDPLTGLYNRHYLKRAFTRAKNSNRKNRSVGAIFCLDLDGFKLINDNYGHLFGDKLLVSVAERLKSNCRRGDLVARFGGDEFVILSEETKDNNIEKIAKHLLANLNQNHYIDGKSISVSASIGAAIIDANVANLHQAMEAADKAMYEVKKTGKGRYVLADNCTRFLEEKISN